MLCMAISKRYCISLIVHCFHLTYYYLQQNVLIDGSGRAVICDFGLSRVKADILSRTRTTDAAAVAGSRYWMAPERLAGKPLRKPCDIYSFGITIYEVILIFGEEMSTTGLSSNFTRSMPTKFR